DDFSKLGQQFSKAFAENGAKFITRLISDLFWNITHRQHNKRRKILPLISSNIFRGGRHRNWRDPRLYRPNRLRHNPTRRKKGGRIVKIPFG
ncbi:MAG: hypothetical protein LBV23_07475, partial [Deltaproteobacteria bacterium]|nr:hypothetical protein [Deltaproteobacteria bacterium]